MTDKVEKKKAKDEERNRVKTWKKRKARVERVERERRERRKK